MGGGFKGGGTGVDRNLAYWPQNFSKSPFPVYDVKYGGYTLVPGVQQSYTLNCTPVCNSHSHT